MTETQVIVGRARVVGDDVNTDYIISSRRKKESLDPQQLRRYLLEDLDPAFAASVQAGDILVAGTNFGCGSAMEVAVTTLQGAGFQAVIARSYSRTYWRNAINNGLLAVVADTGPICEGAMLEIQLQAGGVEILIEQGAGRIQAEPIPEFVLGMRAAGGLVPYLRQHNRLMHKE